MVGRSAAVNHFMAARAPGKLPDQGAFLSSNIWPWIKSYLKFLFHKRHKFMEYPASGNQGLYRVTPSAPDRTLRIAIAGDWATGTQEAKTIAEQMQQATPDFTIHLGDVYYVGDLQEINENCLGVDNPQFSGVKWPHGSQGSFGLNGNHEMYANGDGYFETFLPTLGLGDARNPQGQAASFFCLDTGAWRIVGLDTGYNSVGFPILSLIPGIDSIPAIGGDSHLEAAMLKWLGTVVNPKADPKPTLLLSHHQYFSAFEGSYNRPAQQLIDFFGGQDVVWLWGHEHRLGIYKKYAQSGGITAYGRCVGHGGMPVEQKNPDTAKAPLAFYDKRERTLDGGTVGVNGFVMAYFSGSTLTLEYRDIDNQVLLVEKFDGGPGGALQYTLVDAGSVLTPV